jgi:hypothetical protein
MKALIITPVQRALLAGLMTITVTVIERRIRRVLARRPSSG